MPSGIVMNKLVKIFLLFILLSFNVGYFISPVQATAGDSVATAINLPLNTLTSGSMPGPGSSGSIWYNVSISVTDEYLFNLTGTVNTNFDFIVYDANLNYLAIAYSKYFPETLVLSLDPGDYCLSIFPGSNSNAGTYNITATPYSNIPGQALSHAIDLPFNSTKSGFYPQNLYYNFSVNSSNDYKFKVEFETSLNLNLEVFNASDGSPLNAKSGTSIPRIGIYSLIPGNYFLKIGTPYPQQSGYYNISYSNPDGYSLDHAIDLPVNTVLKGYYPDSVFYNFTVSQAETYEFIASSFEGATISVSVYYGNGTIIDSATTPTNLTLFLQSGIYFLKVVPTLYPTSYNISFSVFSGNSNSSSSSTSPDISSNQSQSQSATNTIDFIDIGTMITVFLIFNVVSLWKRSKKR